MPFRPAIAPAGEFRTATIMSGYDIFAWIVLAILIVMPVASFRSEQTYFVTMCRVGVTVFGASSEIEKVRKVFQPEGRFWAWNSP